jgi:uncharacterized membrane protein YsdA (DUF1294 family)/cold shock CspA family protein
MRIEGLVKTWNDERGFGFIEPIGGGPQIFVHMKAFRSRMIRPQVGQHVSFEVELDRERRKRAKNVEFIRAARVATRHGSKRAGDWGSVTIAAIPAFAVLYAVVAFLWRVPNWVGAVYVGLSIVCFAFYRADKAAANSGSRRTSEEKLLVAGLLGGWPGAILAQQLLRHKSIKASFRSAFWTSVVANVCAFVVLSSPLVDAWSRLARAIS